MKDQIDTHREIIDSLDNDILELLQKRIDEAYAIRELKEAAGIPLDTPERERELINRLIRKAEGKIPPEVVEHIWQTIIAGGKTTGRKISNTDSD